MVRVADTYDALTSSRAYRKNSSPADALKVIEAESERCFDPMIVKLLKQVMNHV
jgi:HD-GYP domain-containing protein (c-di-GMP phosphodiesterase class II)